jgi:Sec-independent protein secretion pathway component TatC
VPLVLLYEISLIAIRLTDRRRPDAEAEQETLPQTQEKPAE